MKATSRNLYILSISLILFSCSSPKEPADRVFTNAKVYTLNESQSWAEAVAIKDNKIVFVGSGKEAKSYIGEATKVSDLAGKMLLPGFVSGHDHLIASKWMSYGANLYPATNKDEYLQIIKEYVENHPEEKVILGIGWNPAIYGGYPTAKELDAIVSDKPAILLEFTIHDAWLNTMALEIGNITKETPDPLPGVTYWNRDTEGNPVGTAIEFAWMPVYVDVGAWQPEKMIIDSQRQLTAAAVAAGITSFLNPGVVTPNINSPDGMFQDLGIAMELLSELNDQGELKMRSFVQPIYKNPNADPVEFAAKSAEFAAKYNSDNLRAFGIKIHPEGNWSSRTSLMLEPYLPDDGDDLVELDRPSPANYGASGVKPDLIKEVVLACNAQGLDVITHVDGSATVRGMIDAIEASREAGYTDARNALHHLFWTHPDDLRRILEMDLLVNVTPNFTTDWSGQDLLAMDLLGEERTREQYGKFPIVFRNGNKVSLSADIPSGPVEHIGPLFQIECAMTLREPGNDDSKVFPPESEGISLELAIKGVTSYPAYQLRMENKIGSIEVGKYADLVVLEKNLFDVEPTDIADVKVLETIMDGKTTFKAE